MTDLPGNLSSGYSWTQGSLEVVGYTLAGITNTMTLPKHHISIDVGQGLPFHMGCKYFFITHGHMDHAHGLPYLIGQKNMMGHPPPQVYMLRSESPKFERILKAWEALEDHSYKYNLVGLNPGDTVELSGNTFMRAFSTTHRVPSLGYTFFERRKKLKSQYSDLQKDDLINLKRQGQSVDEIFEVPLFTYTGDTSSDFLQNAPPWVLESQVLALDVTFWDERKGLDQAKRWGHVHAQELPEILKAFRGDKLLVVHISARHTTSFAQKVLERTLPADQLRRTSIFPRPY